MSETMTDSTLCTCLPQPYTEVIGHVTAALKTEGFGVLTEIDVQATLKNKLDIDFRKYTILGVCNLTLAHQALNTELEIGLLLPCNVLVYEHNDGRVVAIADPVAMMDVTDNPLLQPVASEARTRLQRVIAVLHS